MIPFFKLTTLSLGSVTIQVWGLMVALGILTATWVAARLAIKRGQDETLIWDLCVRVVAAAFVMARVFFFLYEPGLLSEDPLEFFRIWHGGFSIMGGFIGALIAGIWFLRRRQVDVWAYADTAIFALPLGLGIGRIGCFLIHDHPGTLTHFTLGVQYPDGVRHDHGLYLSISGFVLFLIFLWLSRKQVKTGTYIVVFLFWEGISRFFLDFLRAQDGPIVDTRYLNLTPAQYIAVVMVVAGIWLAKKKLSNKS